MLTKKGSMNDLLVVGNAREEAREDGRAGWFIGHFLDEKHGLRSTHDVQVKWGMHRAGEGKSIPTLNEKGTTLTLLISGSYEAYFPELDRSVVLKEFGEYLIFAPGISHSWRIPEDSVIVTVRWPSLPGDSKSKLMK